MNILLIGQGGREHALAWKISQSKRTRKLYIAPGNPGTAAVGENIALKADDFDGLARFCREKTIDLVIVGPETPLVNGIRDHFEKDPGLKNLLIVGPGARGAQLEGSKDFSKLFMLRHGIPTAKAATFSKETLEAGLHYLDSCPLPIVLKADGLAAGKGVIICKDRQEAKDTLREMLVDQLFGAASARVLVEEFLDGIELSVFVLTDGRDYLLLPEAKDYKRIGDHDTGPNTGGMGAVSPVPFADATFMKKVQERVILPTIAGLREEHIPYRGFIFFGLMNVRGEPYVIEYNVRLGDPETEAVLTRIDSDFVEMLTACAQGSLKDATITTDSGFALTVMLVSGGYPGDYEKGKIISGLTPTTNALVFHAGTKTVDRNIVTDGGRVLAVTGRGHTLTEARKNAYQSVGGILWEGVYCRRDIGVDLLPVENPQ